MLKVLKDVKKGAYMKVVHFDDVGNLRMVELHYNPVRRKFYLAENKRGLQRRSISGKVAEKKVLMTLSLKHDHGITITQDNVGTILNDVKKTLHQHTAEKHHEVFISSSPNKVVRLRTV